MKKINTLIISLFLIVFSLSSLVHAKTENWNINLDHSKILFNISYLSISDMTGRFNNFDGIAKIKTSGKASIESIDSIIINIDVNELDTGKKMRDGHLKSQDFFNIKSYPIIKFSSQKVIKNTESEFTAIGLLKIKSIEKEIGIKFSISAPLIDAWDKKSRIVKFDFKFNRSQFGLHWNKLTKDNKYLVGEEVNVYGDFQLQKDGNKTAASKHMVPLSNAINLREKLKDGKITLAEFQQESKLGEVVQADLKDQKLEETKIEKSEVQLKENNLNQKPHLYRRDLFWWLSFITLSLFGFFGSIMLAIQFKNIISKKPIKYNEVGLAGILSDIPVLLIVFLYAACVWEIGRA